MTCEVATRPRLLCGSGKGPTVDARLVDGVNPPLVEEDGEDEVVPEDGQAVHGGHLDDEREQVVDDGVEELVRHLAPGEVRHRLELRARG